MSSEPDIADRTVSQTCDALAMTKGELEAGLLIQNDLARRYFRRTNAELMNSVYWMDIPRKLERGEVVGLKAYPDYLKLDVGDNNSR